MPVDDGSRRMNVAGEELVLLRRSRRLTGVARRRCCVADPHFGKAARSARSGCFVPRGTTTASALAARCAAHRDGRSRSSSSATFCTRARDGARRRCARSRRGATALVRRDAAGARQSRSCAPAIHRVQVGIECVDGPVLDGPFALAHHPRVVPERVRARRPRASVRDCTAPGESAYAYRASGSGANMPCFRRSASSPDWRTSTPARVTVCG